MSHDLKLEKKNRNYKIFHSKHILLMSESQYQPRHCAFHPKELIFNFCKNPECLLPLCPSCIKVHTEEHKTEKTYGQFEK